MRQVVFNSIVCLLSLDRAWTGEENVTIKMKSGDKIHVEGYDLESVGADDGYLSVNYEDTEKSVFIPVEEIESIWVDWKKDE